MKIMLCNDDGVHADGIRVLYETLCDIADVTVVAPSEERSATGQTLTLDHPVRIEEVKKDFYSVTGFPADAALLGLIEVMDKKPDLVISGINRGANLGQDIYYSGTVAAARQATFQKVPAIAISTVIDNKPHDYSEIKYQTAANYIKTFLQEGLHQHIDPLSLLNINVPDLPEDEIKGVDITTLGFRQYSEEVEKRYDSRNREYFWIGGRFVGHSTEPGTDCYAIDNSRISINPLNLIADSTDLLLKWREIVR